MFKIIIVTFKSAKTKIIVNVTKENKIYLIGQFGEMLTLFIY